MPSVVLCKSRWNLSKKRVPVHNYGSAIAPFFTNIALWVGGFVLIAVMKIEVDASSLKAARRALKHKQAKSSFAAAVRTRVRNSEAFMGRWLLFALLGAAQGFVATVGRSHYRYSDGTSCCFRVCRNVCFGGLRNHDYGAGGNIASYW